MLGAGEGGRKALGGWHRGCGIEMTMLYLLLWGLILFGGEGVAASITQGDAGGGGGIESGGGAGPLGEVGGDGGGGAQAQREFTLEELRGYNGTDPTRPLYLAIKGVVFDVTAGAKFYGPGKSYSKFAGRDITRSTAMFSTSEKDLDRRDYPPEKQAALDKTFERTYVKKYIRVGTLLAYEYDVPDDENQGAEGSGRGAEGSDRVWDKDKQRFVEKPMGGGAGGSDVKAWEWSLAGFFGWLLGLVARLVKAAMAAVGASGKGPNPKEL